MATISNYTLTIVNDINEEKDIIIFGNECTSKIIHRYVEDKYRVSDLGRTITAQWSVKQCDFDMEMFKSGHISIELNLKRIADQDDQKALPFNYSNNYLYSMSDVQDALQGAKVTLKYTAENDSKTVTVATDYFIYDVNCVSKNTDNDNLTVNLDIYSVDKLLDLQPMTKAYTAQKLPTIIKDYINVVNTTLENKTGLEKKLKINTSNHLNILRHYFKITIKDKNGNETPLSSKLDLLLPYLVQYNETFYSFLRRVCARCGEFLYFENGELHYGLQTTDKKDIVKIGSNDNEYCSVSTKRNTEQFKQFDVTSWHRNSIDSKDDPDYPTQDYVNESQIGNDDFIKPLKVMESRKSPLVDMFANGLKWKEGFGDYAKNDNLIKEIYQVLRIIASAPSGKKALIKTGIELLWNYPTSLHMKQRDKDNRAYKCNMLLADSKNPRHENYKYVEVEQKYESKISQFSTVQDIATNSINMVNVNLGELTEELYNAIHYWASENANKEIEIDLGNYATDIKLGSEIMIPNDSNSYIVTSIKGSFTVGSTNYKRIAHAIPQATIQLKDKDSKTLWLPTPIDNVVAKAQGPMTGFVTETDDPYRQGRVRVRMSWQNTSDKDATPWVRVAMPMAGEWGNMTLQPGVGDEVLVDFENGNMERPYVRGSLFNSKHEAKILKANTCVHGGSPLHRSFTSGKGTGLFIEDQDFGLSDWLSLISPVLGKGLLQIPPYKTEVNKATKLPVGAKMELKDYYGFYKIAMSSKDRQVSIESPLGKVSINAFTGISISAPNGDIKIEGKNIDIKAGNRLSLTSGTNIGLGGGEGRGLSPGGTVAEILLEIAKAIADSVLGKKILDLSLVRSVLEIFLRPVNCTMQIKSRRHLVLEAGRGTAEIPYDSIKANANAKYKNVVNAGYPYYIMRSLYVDMQNQTDGFAKGAIQAYNALANFGEQYVRAVVKGVDNMICRDNVDKAKFVVLTEADKTKLSFDKCSQLYQNIELKDGVYKFTGTDEKKYVHCPIPDTMKEAKKLVKGLNNNIENASVYYKKWISRVDEFIRLECNYLNAMRGNQLKYNEAIDAIVESQAAKRLLTKRSDVRDAFSEVKTAVGQYSTSNHDYFLVAGEGENETAIPYMDSTNFCDAVKNKSFKKATRFSLNGVAPAGLEITYLFIKALNKVKLVSYVGTDKPMPNGKYDKNHTIPATLDEIIKASGKTPEENWETFLNGIVPYFHDEKQIGFVEKAKDKLQGFLESEFDYDNIKAVEGMFNGERDMWDATTNRGSIVMSDSTGSNTTRLEDNGEFKKYENASIQSLIKAFKTTIAPKPQAVIDVHHDAKALIM